MPIFIVTVEFDNVDDVAVEVEAGSHLEAADLALDYFGDDCPEAAHAMTTEEFEADFGTYEPGMFERI